MSDSTENITQRSGKRLTLFAATALFLTVSTSLPLANNAYSHSLGPVGAYPQVYHMQAGQALTENMRLCVMTGGDLTVTSITFRGNNSSWAKVEKDLPVNASEASNGATSVDIPVTVSVPSNFTGKYALIQTIIDLKSLHNSSPAVANLPVIISNSTGSSSHQYPPECRSLNQIQTARMFNSTILASTGAALGAVGYFGYRRSKIKSASKRASCKSKILLIFLAIVAFFLMVGAYLSPFY